jgi:hypothetical protein
MADDYQTYAVGVTGPAERAAAVTPNDSTDLPISSRGLWVGGGGSIVIITTKGDEVTLAGVPGGSLLPIRAARVKATGTTATSIVALW